MIPKSGNRFSEKIMLHHNILPKAARIVMHGWVMRD
jgi:hypothetical protein